MGTITVDGNEYDIKEYTWDELVELFPSKWVILKNAKLDKSDVETGILVGVCSDGEKDGIVLNNLKQGHHYDYFRTTEDGINIGIVGGIV